MTMLLMLNSDVQHLYGQLPYNVTGVRLPFSYFNIHE